VLSLIDTHAHLDEIENLDEAVKQAVDRGIIGIVAVGTDYVSNQKVLEIARKHQNFVYPALGLHPGHIGHMTSAELERTLQQIEDNIHNAVAVGEVGLDYDKRVRALAPKERQKEVLAEVLEISIKHHKPALVHSRYAWKDALLLAREKGVPEAVFHWYTGPTSVLRDIIAQGYYISATPAAEYHAEHRRAVREAPLSHLLLETDAPVVYGREQKYASLPGDVVRTLDAVAELKGMEKAALAEQTTTNAVRLFSLPAAE